MGKPRTPVDIWIEQLVKGPDGMRAANRTLFVAENGNGIIAAIVETSDKAQATVLKEGLKTPTGIEPACDSLWFIERVIGKAESVPMPK